MYRKGEVRYEALPLPDRVEMDEASALAASERFLAYMRRRHSVREYSTRPVPEAIITACIAAAGTAPSGANHQPWHFVAISDPAMKTRIREGAEDEERAFYSGGAGDEWLAALEPIGTGVSKPHLTDAPWHIAHHALVVAQLMLEQQRVLPLEGGLGGARIGSVHAVCPSGSKREILVAAARRGRDHSCVAQVR